jgi:hypothetical protein
MFNRKTQLIFLVICFSLTAIADAGHGDWSHYGHDATRHSIAIDGPNTIDVGTLAWVADTDPQDPNYYVEFEGASGPVVYNGKVYAYAKYFEPNEESLSGFDYTHSQIIAYDANSGQMLWAAVLDNAIWDSWSTPSIDNTHNTVLIGSGDKIFAFDAQTSTQKWATQLDRNVINASVCTALDIPHARAFITDYSGYSSLSGKLYCINLDPNEPNNPYEPGQIVWSDTIGSTSGNSPAYKNGVVYVASITDPNNPWPSGGAIHAYDATAATPAKLWQNTDPNFEGFTGGVTVTKQGFLYAANYDFYGEGDNSALCKIDCNDGSIVWITQTERTSSMPVVAGDKIYISGGLEGYGSHPKVEAYQDLGTAVTKLWETPLSMAVGGWLNQPVYANGKLYVGAIPLEGNYFGAYTDLYILNVALTADDPNLIPDDPNFIIDHYSGGCGNSPAVTYDSIYSIGYNYTAEVYGLFKFHQPALLADISKNNVVDMNDLAEFVKSWLYDGPIGVIRSDLDLDGDVDFVDFSLLANEWRKELSGQ